MDPTKPNVVILLADDMGIGDPGCYNPASKIHTPNIDRIAREGMRFLDCHSPSGVCSPTRYALLTGRYPWRTRMKQGVLHGYSRSLIEPGQSTVASILSRNGYKTAAIGKWHLGFQTFEPGRDERNHPVDYRKPLRPGPVTVGFDSFFGIPASLDMDPYLFVVDDRAVELPTSMIGASGDSTHARGPFWRAGKIAPSFRHADVLPQLTKHAIAFLDERGRDQNRTPFFLYLAFSAPHTPYLPAAKFSGKSGAGDYGDFVEMVDQSVGSVLAALDRNALSSQTLLIFTSDNGARWTPEEIAQFGHRSNLHYRGQKSDIFEGGNRIPFLARWPGRVAPASICSELGCLIDLPATCAAACGVHLSETDAPDSFNLLPALMGAASKRILRESLVLESGGGMFALRAGRWKFIRGLGSGGFTKPQRIMPTPGGPKGQLYDLQSDPGESTNLYLERADIVRALSRRLETIEKAARSRPAS